jgi:hypothetical protein
MFTVEKQSTGEYLISIGIGRKVKAESLQYVAYALEHYFQDRLPGYGEGKFDMLKHREHNKECGCCPLCRS